MMLINMMITFSDYSSYSSSWLKDLNYSAALSAADTNTLKINCCCFINCFNSSNSNCFFIALFHSEAENAVMQNLDIFTLLKQSLFLWFSLFTDHVPNWGFTVIPNINPHGNHVPMDRVLKHCANSPSHNSVKSEHTEVLTLMISAAPKSIINKYPQIHLEKRKQRAKLIENRITLFHSRLLTANSATWRKGPDWHWRLWRSENSYRIRSRQSPSPMLTGHILKDWRFFFHCCHIL